MIRDIDARFVRARFPEYEAGKADQVLADLEQTRGTHRGVKWEDLLHLPDRRWFRRKGEHAFAMVGVDGEAFTEAEDYLRYVARHVNEGYCASRDLMNYADVLRKISAGRMTAADGVKAMPRLKRVGGTCPCSKGVRWVMEGSAADRAVSSTGA